MKKLAVLGRGTVGCMTVAHYLRWTDWEIDWIYDPLILPATVGEGTTLVLPRSLDANLRFDSEDLNRIGSTVKTGIFKKNWGIGKAFTHSFPVGAVGIHFNAVAFQDYVFEKVSKNSRVKLIEENITPDNIDADYVMVCSGTPKNFTDYETADHIPVNACYVSQCPWEYARFTHTLTIARPHGWIFGIPLQHRCAIGYLYNESITPIEEVKKDVENILNEYNLVPNMQRHIQFKNYYRKKNFSNRIVYNGNSSFFLEPLEATSTTFADSIIRYAFDIWNNNISVERAENQYSEIISSTESMIAMHYMSGSIFENEFWSYAKALGEEKLKKDFTNDTEFAKIIRYTLDSDSNFDEYHKDVGTWSSRSYLQNIVGLGLKEKLTELSRSK
jgi:tryptophan halogenase